MLRHAELSDSEVRRLIRSGEIVFAGNRKLKIFGRLDCASGRRMKRANRVFFASDEHAQAEDYRPCGHCMKDAFQQWRIQRPEKH